MRCTKCSFISFDDLSTCAKCATDLSHLANELNGTCTEARQAFFLGSAIQSTGLDEDSFSDSQALPPIDHGDMNFDDTSTGGFSPLSPSPVALGSGLDDSVGVVDEDDVAIELGDIMPIDLEQLDSGSVSSEVNLESTDAMSAGDINFDVDKTASIESIDLDLSGSVEDTGLDLKFDDDLSSVDIDDSSLDFSVDMAGESSKPADTHSDVAGGDVYGDVGFELDQELLEQLSDGDNTLDETTSLNAEIGLSDTTQAASFAIGDGGLAALELDESLVAELARTPSPDISGEFVANFSDDHSSSGEFELDAALAAELAHDENVGAASDGAQSAAESLAVGADEVSRETNVLSAPVQFEDLTGEFPLIREDDETEFAGLDLADIDVSDLVDPTDAGLNVVGDERLMSQGSADVLSESAALANAEEASRGADANSQDESALTADGGDALGFADDSSSEGLGRLEDDRGGDGFSSDDSSQGSVGPAGDVMRESGPVDGVLAEAEGGDLQGAFAGAGLSLEEPGVVEGDDLGVDLESLAYDAEFEAFLGKKVGDDKLPETELLADDDEGDEPPPDLPS